VSTALARVPPILRGWANTQISSLLGLLIVAVAVALTLGQVFSHGANYFFQIVVIGVADGAIYALIALGYTMVYGIIELINFAHGDVFTLGAFVSLALMPLFGVTEGKSGIGWLVPMIIIALATMLICGAINVAIERIAYRPLRHAPRLAPLITAIGMSAILEGAMYIWRGPFNLHYPDLLPDVPVNLGPIQLSTKDLIVIVVAVIMVVALTMFIRRVVSAVVRSKTLLRCAQRRWSAASSGVPVVEPIEPANSAENTSFGSSRGGIGWFDAR